MDKRKEKRYKTRQIVKVCGKLGVVNDVSVEGIQVSVALSPKNRNVDISLDIDGKSIELIGIIQWMKQKQRLQQPNEFGIILKDVPPEYITFVEEFNSR